MQDISNSVRERLGARPAPKVHPDPDLLTAYVEQVLPPGERSQVIQHLAECGYCRQVVALSLPELQPEQVVTQAPVRSRWRIPAYRWAAAVATIAIAAAVVIEKPWQTKSSFQQVSQASGNSQAAAPTPVTTEPKTLLAQPAAENREKAVPPGNVTAEHIGVEPARPTLRDDRARADQAPKAFGTVGGAIGGLRQNAPAPQPPPPQAVAEARAEQEVPTDTAHKDADKDYLNRTILTNQEGLPEAPSPKVVAGQDSGQVRKGTPKLSEQNLDASKMEVGVVTPQTEAAPSSPSAGDSNLAKSGGFMPRFKSTVGPAIRTVISAAKKASAAKPPAMPGAFATPSAVSSRAEADQEASRATSGRIHWSITSDGKLLRSTDVGQWHEVNPQGPDIRFRVVEPHDGPEVWVGGNHGTLIHSWNAGVNWSQLNVPDSSTSDITAISIDGDNVQVKTSNGQTFVSEDHGKTWVPLQQQPK